MNNANIKFFWNGLKVAGDRKMSVKGFWSYQAPVSRGTYQIAEHVTFYADSACGGNAGEICESFGGNGYSVSLDDCYTKAQFTLTPADARWADAMAAAITGQERCLVRMERATAKNPTPYNVQDCKYQVQRIADMQSTLTPAPSCVNPIPANCLCDGSAGSVCYPTAASKAASAELSRLEALIGPL